MAGQLRVDEITDEAGTGSPSFPFGLPVGYAAGGTAPAAGSFTEVPNNVLEVGDPIRSVDIIALRDNPIAIAEGADDAPRISRLALDKELQTLLIYGTALNEPEWYYSSATATLAANVQHMILVMGSGGGGGKGPDALTRLHGGNGGDAAILFVKPSSSTSLTITIGAGGAGRNTNGDGSDGAATTVVGTGININVPGARGGVYATGIPQLTNHFNAANADPSGADFFFKGGRTRSFIDNDKIHGSCAFGSNGTNFFSGMFQSGSVFVSGGDDSFVNVSYDLHTTQSHSAGQGANAVRFFNGTPLTLNDRLTQKIVRKNFLSLVLPPLTELFNPVPMFNTGPLFGLHEVPPFVGGRHDSAITNDDFVQRGGATSGGGPNSNGSTNRFSGRGGNGLVIIWSFVNG